MIERLLSRLFPSSGFFHRTEAMCSWRAAPAHMDGVGVDHNELLSVSVGRRGRPADAPAGPCFDRAPTRPLGRRGERGPVIVSAVRTCVTAAHLPCRFGRSRPYRRSICIKGVSRWRNNPAICAKRPLTPPSGRESPAAAGTMSTAPVESVSITARELLMVCSFIRIGVQRDLYQTGMTEPGGYRHLGDCALIGAWPVRVRPSR
jgi:hypothetical protein